MDQLTRRKTRNRLKAHLNLPLKIESNNEKKLKECAQKKTNKKTGKDLFF